MKSEWADKRCYRQESDTGWFGISVFCALGLIFWAMFLRSLGML